MIEFPCPHCSVNILAEPEHAGATASCPTCGEGLVVPATSDDIGNEDRQGASAGNTGSLQPIPELQKKSAPKVGKKLLMIGTLSLVGAVTIGAVALTKPFTKNPDVEGDASARKPKITVNLASIGGTLDDFVDKFGDGKSVAVVSTGRVLNYDYKGFVTDSNTILIVGYDKDQSVTCLVYFVHDGNQTFNAISLDSKQIDSALRLFSRHEGRGWTKLSSDGEEIGQWGYFSSKSSHKWSHSSLMALYKESQPYLLILNTYPENNTLQYLTSDMGVWEIYAPR